MPTMTPTHRCFDDALDFISERVTLDPELAHGVRLHLVHGILLAPANTVGVAPGQPFAHAWVEEDVGLLDCAVWDAGLVGGVRVYYSVSRKAFFEKMRPQDMTRYTVREAYEQNVRTNHFGPWRLDYVDLCRKKV